MKFKNLPKLTPGDKVAILSPSFAAPGKWPHVYRLGLKRLREVFNLEPIELPTTAELGASANDRAKDLIDAFKNREIKAVISSLGGDDQVTYIKDLPSEPFVSNPKPFFGYSDNSHFVNHLWHNRIPSYYGGSLFTEFAMQGQMDDFTVKYLREALFNGGNVELGASPVYNDIGLPWKDPDSLDQRRKYEPNEGWYWDGDTDAAGISWGGCLESIDEMLRHGIDIPKLDEFEEVVLFTETSELLPEHRYVARVYRALGERGILGRVRAILVGRPKAWDFGKSRNAREKAAYRARQRESILEMVRAYRPDIPVVQNLDFGHTAPQICLPVGRRVEVLPSEKKIVAEF